MTALSRPTPLPPSHTSPAQAPLIERARPALMLAVFCIGMAAFFQVYSVQAILPLFMRDLGASEMQAGMTVGATVLGVALMSPFMGMLSDAIGRKSIIVASLLLLAVPTALLALADSIHAIVMLRLLQGLCVPGITVVLIAWMGEEFAPHIMGRMMTLYVSGTVLGGFLGRFVLGHLSDLTGWRVGFAVMAALCLACAALAVWQLTPSRHFHPNARLRSALTTLAAHLRNPCVLSASALGACVLCSLVGCFTYINLHLADAPYRLDSAALANLFAVYLVGMVMTPLSARLIARLGSVRTVLLAVVLSMTGVLGTLLVPLPAIVLGLTLTSSGVFITQAATISFIATHVRTGRSLATGLYYMAYYGGGTLGAWLCGLAYERGSWGAVVAALLLVQTAALLIAGRAMQTAAQTAAQPVQQHGGA